MSNNFSPLSNSMSALLEFWIWSDAKPMHDAFSDAGFLSCTLALESSMIAQNSQN